MTSNINGTAVLSTRAAQSHPCAGQEKAPDVLQEAGAFSIAKVAISLPTQPSQIWDQRPSVTLRQEDYSTCAAVPQDKMNKHSRQQHMGDIS